jgi:hypothetical protein
MDEGTFPWSQIPIQIYIAAAVIVFILIVVAAIVGWMLWRRARRSGAWGAAKLLLQSELDPSPARRAVANLRVEVDEAVRETNRAMQVLTDQGWPTGDLPSLTRRLESIVRPLHTELVILSHEPDEDIVRRAIPEAETRVRRACEIGDGIRQAATASLRHETDQGLDSLSADAQLEWSAIQSALDELAARQKHSMLPIQGT